jgi:hypothetical protein
VKEILKALENSTIAGEKYGRNWCGKNVITFGDGVLSI